MLKLTVLCVFEVFLYTKPRNLLLCSGVTVVQESNRIKQSSAKKFCCAMCIWYYKTMTTSQSHYEYPVNCGGLSLRIDLGIDLDLIEG